MTTATISSVGTGNKNADDTESDLSQERADGASHKVTTQRTLQILLVCERVEVEKLVLQTVQGVSTLWQVEVCRSARDTAATSHALRPDVALLDVGENGVLGAESVRALKMKWPPVPVLVLNPGNRGETFPVLMAGASGLLAWPLSPDPFATQICRAARGYPVLCLETQRMLLEFLHTSNARARFPRLSEREAEVFILMLQNRSDKEIAQKLRLSPGTVHAHLARAYKKMDIHSRREAKQRAFSGGVIS